MKIVTLSGSPRKNGHTSRVLSFFEKLVGETCEVDRIEIPSYTVNGCLGCDACRKHEREPGCVQKDDAVSIFKRMMGSDCVIYASPLYCWCFSAQMKALIDRHFCLVKGYGSPDYRSLLEGKHAALLVTCDGPIENNADLIQGVFDRFTGYCKCRVVGKYIVPFCNAPGTIDAEGMSVAKKMARDILGSCRAGGES